MEATQEAFWNQTWAARKPYRWDAAALAEQGRPTEQALWERTRRDGLGGKRVLDLGCGTGRLSVLAARAGAHVTAVDASQEAVAQTRALADFNDVAARVEARKMNALHVGRLGTRFDLAVGMFVLHHVEPFAAFADTLADVLADGGRGIFYENNARNPVLMFSRKYLAGRLGIPKHGDDHEHPLQPREIEALRHRCAWVHVHYPTLVFFRMLNTYLFRGKARYASAMEALGRLDEVLYDRLPALHKYSYHQIVEFGA